MKQTHIIVKPEHIAPLADPTDAEWVTDWMHGHSVGDIPNNPIARAVWSKPSKAQRRLYSGAMEHIG